MAMYKITYTDLGRNKEMKEVFPNLNDCKTRMAFLRTYPKGCIGQITRARINDGFHIRYSLLGVESVPDEWRCGMAVHYKDVPKWYDGYEEWVETEKEMLNFIKEKKSIVNKTYRHFIVEHIVNDMVVTKLNF
jgi:hypothetical protein